MVELPRGWLKSTVCSIAFPVWCAVKQPNFRCLIVHNTHTNACSKLKVIKGIFEKNHLFRALWPDLLPTSDCVWKTEALCINRPKEFDAATFEAAGRGTQVTGRHYNLIIEDDTVAPEDSDFQGRVILPTSEDVEQAIGWHVASKPLLVDLARDRIIVVGTRWFERDLLSWIQEEEGSLYEIYRRYDRENGVPVYPERFNDDVLKMLEVELGPYIYSCLYRNQPLRADDMTFKEKWFEYYETPPQSLICYTSVDPAGDPESAKGKKGDFNVVCTTGKDVNTGRVYVLDYSRERCNPGKLISLIFEHVKKYSPVKVAVESNAYQNTLQYWLRERQQKNGVHFLVESFSQSKIKKSQRITGLQPLFASGTIWIKKWMVELRTELMAFPYGKTDDVVDALASQLPLWRVTPVKDKVKTSESNPFTFESAVRELQERVTGEPVGVADLVWRDHEEIACYFT